MKKKLTYLLSSFFLILALGGITSVNAETLDGAKAKGLIGEQADGYLGVVTSQVPADVVALVKDINSKRKDKYKEIAKKNGTDVKAVEVLAGQKAIELTPGGQFVKLSGQSWQKK